MPASLPFIATCRLVAASVGAACGLAVDDLEDLRLGVDELVSALVAVAAGPDDRIDLELVAGDAAVRIAGGLRGGGPVAGIDDLTRRILDAVVDEHELAGTSFTLTKRSTLTSAAPGER
ncbi:MAG: hypothetical protein ABW328_12830 [Ilumatobacteraceae bacterium]